MRIAQTKLILYCSWTGLTMTVIDAAISSRALVESFPLLDKDRKEEASRQKLGREKKQQHSFEIWNFECSCYDKEKEES